MIVVKVIGGLGNQMFQIAYARMLSLEYNENIYLDLSAYEKYKIRDFSLANLEISQSFNTIDNSLISKKNIKISHLSQESYRIYQKIFKSLRYYSFGNIPYKTLQNYGYYYNFDRYYYETLINKKDLKFIYGYFQSEKYFFKYKNIIKEELKVKTLPTDKEKEILKKINSKISVGVSLRLGEDYKKNQGLNVCTPEYYIKGMQHIFNLYKEVEFFIFSDCIEEAKNLLLHTPYKLHFIEGFNDYQSLRLLYSCKHFVIANSSFSWWGAYLSDNPSKVVIAPDRWFNGMKKQPDIFYDEMTILEVKN